MLTYPTTDRLRKLGLAGMTKALEEQRRHTGAADLGFEERLAMLVECEALERDAKRLATRLRFAGLRQQATPEDVDHRAVRGLDRGLFQKLTSGEWIERHQDLLVTGPTGNGKTGCPALSGIAPAATIAPCCYHRVPRLLEALGIARGDGRYARTLKAAPSGHKIRSNSGTKAVRCCGDPLRQANSNKRGCAKLRRPFSR